jgi:hypothetical protein
VLGLNLAREELPGRFRPALTIAWPDRSDEVDDPEGFLLAARKRIVARSEVLADAEGFSRRGNGRSILVTYFLRICALRSKRSPVGFVRRAFGRRSTAAATPRRFWSWWSRGC